MNFRRAPPPPHTTITTTTTTTTHPIHPTLPPNNPEVRTDTNYPHARQENKKEFFELLGDWWVCVWGVDLVFIKNLQCARKHERNEWVIRTGRCDIGIVILSMILMLWMVLYTSIHTNTHCVSVCLSVYCAVCW